MNINPTERRPRYCQACRYIPGKGILGCSKLYDHEDSLHSFDEGQQCDKGASCPADFHEPHCLSYLAEEAEAERAGEEAKYGPGPLSDKMLREAAMLAHPAGKGRQKPPGRHRFDERTDRLLVALHTEETKPGRAVVEHYTVGEIETIEFIRDKLGPDGTRAYVLGNILKYASRALHKGQFDSDIEKIRNYAVILQELEVRDRNKNGDNTDG